MIKRLLGSVIFALIALLIASSASAFLPEITINDPLTSPPHEIIVHENKLLLAGGANSFRVYDASKPFHEHFTLGKIIP